MGHANADRLERPRRITELRRDPQLLLCGHPLEQARLDTQGVVSHAGNVAMTARGGNSFAPEHHLPGPYVTRHTRPLTSSAMYSSPFGPTATPVGRCFARSGCFISPANPSANTE